MSVGRELTWNTRDKFERPKNPEGSQGFDVKETGFREDAHEDTEGPGKTHKNAHPLKSQKNTLKCTTAKDLRRNTQNCGSQKAYTIGLLKNPKIPEELIQTHKIKRLQKNT